MVVNVFKHPSGIFGPDTVWRVHLFCIFLFEGCVQNLTEIFSKVVGPVLVVLKWIDLELMCTDCALYSETNNLKSYIESQVSQRSHGAENQNHVTKTIILKTMYILYNSSWQQNVFMSVVLHIFILALLLNVCVPWCTIVFSLCVQRVNSDNQEPEIS